MLIGARFVQGVGGALTSAVILGMIVTMFPEPRRAGEGDRRLQLRRLGRRRRSACWPAACSPQAINWHWIFFVNLPIGIATAVAGACGCSSATQGIGLGRGADVPGALLVTGALMLGVYTIVERGRLRLGLGAHARPRRGRRWRCWRRSSSARRRAANPLMPLRIFRSRNVSGREPGPGR